MDNTVSFPMTKVCRISIKFYTGICEECARNRE